MSEGAKRFDPFVAVHVGAGNHSQNKKEEYKKLAQEATKLGLELLKDGFDSENVCVMVGKRLEDSRLTNSGSGSQLNFNGQVECDASIMSSDHRLAAAVGTVSGVLNPIDLAHRILLNALGPKDRRGRSKPLFLAGRGARDFAEQAGAKCVAPYSMVTQVNQQTYDLWKAVVENDEKNSGFEGDDGDEKITDTIGIICGNENGVVTVAASSGGVLLKQPGRVGPAAIPRSGIAINKTESGLSAACATGHGEDIITTNLATTCLDYLEKGNYNEADAYQRLFADLPKHYPHLQSDPLYLGLLAVTQSQTGATISYAHTSESMILAYGSETTPPRAIHSKNKTVGKVCFGAVCA